METKSPERMRLCHEIGGTRRRSERGRSIASKFGMAAETLRSWVRQAERDRGLKPGPTSEELVRIKELEREVKELRRANEILKAASAFFARER